MTRDHRATRFGAVIADPPWFYKDRLPGKSRGAGKNYKLMTNDEIRDYLPSVEAQGYRISRNALLFMWRAGAFGEVAFDIMRAWGFEPNKGEIVWVKRGASGKLRIGMGRTVRWAHEVCYIGRRGSPVILDRGLASVIEEAPRLHSQKPEAFYQMVRRLVRGPYLELFGRTEREGFTNLGDQDIGPALVQMGRTP